MEAGEGKGSEEEDVEDADQVSLQTAAAAQGKASTVSPNIEDVISIHSLSEIERQTIVEIVSSFPNLTEGQLKSIEVLVQSTQLSKQSIMSLVIHGAAVPVSGSPPVLSAELEKKFTNISNLMSKASDEQIKGKLRKVIQSLVEAGQSNVCGNVALTQEHLKRLDEAFEETTNVRQLTNTPSATLSNFTKLTPAGAATLLGRNSMSSFGGHGGEASSASSAGSSQRVRFPVPETLQESEKRREQREVDGKKDDLSRSNLPVFVSVNSPLNLRRENLGDQAFEPVRMAAHNLAVAAAEYCYVNMTAHTLLTYMIVAAVNKQIHRFYNLAGGMLVEMGYPPARSVVDNLEKLKVQDEEIRPDIMCLQNANDMAAYHLASISGLFLGAAGVIFSNGFDNTALSKEACRMVAKVYNFDFGDDVTQFQRQLNGFVKVVEQAQMMTLNLDDHKKINPALTRPIRLPLLWRLLAPIVSLPMMLVKPNSFLENIQIGKSHHWLCCRHSSPRQSRKVTSSPLTSPLQMQASPPRMRLQLPQLQHPRRLPQLRRMPNLRKRRRNQRPQVQLRRLTNVGHSTKFSRHPLLVPWLLLLLQLQLLSQRRRVLHRQRRPRNLTNLFL